MVRRKGKIWLGTSGWSYKHWHGPFYPPDLPVAEELAYASKAFSSLEINRSFYALLTPAMCKQWADTVPRDFVFAAKGSGFITHRKQLNNVETALANFFASGLLLLGRKLGPIVWQLPASRAFNPEKLSTFLALLPRTLSQAAQLARGHDDRARHGTHTEVDADGPLRHCLEARHESFFSAESLSLLRAHDVALAVSESPTWPTTLTRTASFAYVRLHGSSQLYTSKYRERELKAWAERILAWRDGGDGLAPADVYVYFDNDVAGRAAHDALRLQTLLSRDARRTRHAAKAPEARAAPSRGVP